LTFQHGISKYQHHGGRYFIPYAFIEQSIIMLLSALNSPKTIELP